MYLSDIVEDCQKSPKNMRISDFEGNISSRFSVGQGKKKRFLLQHLKIWQS
jgi:hypothetical protein